jgi:hypothetical protein
VDTVQIQGPIQFVLGDSELGRPRAFPLGVYGDDGRPIALFTASMFLIDSSVAQLRGTTIYPQLRGVSLVQVNIGDHEGAMGVHIYQRVGGLDALDTLLRVHPGRRQFAVPLHMESGKQYRQWLPPGGWMLTLLPREEDGHNPIRMFVDGAACDSNILNDPGRLGCNAGSRASVIVYRPFSSRPEAPARAYLLVRGLGGGEDPGHFVLRVRAIPAALVCVKDFLGARGYALRRESAVDQLMQMNRPDGQLGTAARREWIEVRFIAEDSTLRGKAWAVDSYPAVDVRLHDKNPIRVAPAEETLTAAREALQQCGSR